MKNTHPMKHSLLLWTLLLLSLFGLSMGFYHEGQKVLLENVKALTLYRGEYTTGSRSSPVPQLKCVGGSARQYAKDIDVVQCTNVGWDGDDVQWKCETPLDSRIRFGRISVSCEGYDSPEDPHILAGSCGLEYSLEYTSGSHSNSYGNHGYDSYQTGGGSRFGRFILLGIIAFIAYNIYQQCVRVRGGGMGAPPPTGGGQYWGSGRPGGPGGPGYYGGGGYNNNCQPPPSSYGNSNWQPGFWSGLATGGALGHLFTRGRTHGYGGGSMFGARSGIGGGSSMGSLRTASGFGGTRRR